MISIKNLFGRIFANLLVNENRDFLSLSKFNFFRNLSTLRIIKLSKQIEFHYKVSFPSHLTRSDIDIDSQISSRVRHFDRKNIMIYAVICYSRQLRFIDDCHSTFSHLAYWHSCQIRWKIRIFHFSLKKKCIFCSIFHLINQITIINQSNVTRRVNEEIFHEQCRVLPWCRCIRWAYSLTHRCYVWLPSKDLEGNSKGKEI